jgi:hypothetical protein
MAGNVVDPIWHSALSDGDNPLTHERDVLKASLDNSVQMLQLYLSGTVAITFHGD